MREQDIQNAVLDYLSYKGVFHYRQNSGAYRTQHGSFVRYGTPGSPDIIVVEDGRYIGLEIKKPTGVQSKSQKEFQKKLEEAGGEYHLIRSIDDVLALF